MYDEEEEEIKNSLDQDYWARTYSFGFRIGENKLLISDEAVHPWFKESFSKKDRFQPTISSTAIRAIDAIEFEPLDFDESAVSEIASNRLYYIDGSEEQGFALLKQTGKYTGYALMAEQKPEISATNEDAKFGINVVPMTFTFSENRNIYSVSEEFSEMTFGGVFVVPVSVQPGLIAYCVIGMFQKVGGIWKLICPESDTNVYPEMGGFDFLSYTTGIGSEMNNLCEYLF